MKELSEEARRLRNLYFREWKRKNLDKVRLYDISYWERKARNITPLMRVKELHAQGKTQRQIAEELGISLGCVNKFLNMDEHG